MLVWLTLLLSWQFANQSNAGAERYGKLLAESVATLAREPLLKQDRIGLGLISNQLSAMPGVTGITILGVNNEVLSMTRERARGQDYSHAIALEDAVIGYARVTINPGAVEPQPLWPWVVGALLVLAMPWLLNLFAAGVAAIDAASDRRRAARAAALSAEDPPPAPPADVLPPPQDRYVVVANLLNQFALTVRQRQQALDVAARGAASLAGKFDGTSEVIGDTGLALWFEEDSEDRADQVLACALLITRLLPELEHNGTFRVAMHRHTASDEATSAGAVLRDTALMTAAAGPGQVIVSSTCSSYLSEPTVASASALVHPLGSDFTTTAAHCQRITRLTTAAESELSAQFDDLRDQFGSTERESTF